MDGRRADGDASEKNGLQLPKNPHRWSDSGGPFWVRNTDPVLGPCVCFQLRRGFKKRTRFWGRISSPEASAVWQWFHFLQERAPPGRPVLRLNLDETSVRFWYEPRRGLRRPRKEVPRAGFARKASRAQLRKAFTHIAIICDDSSLQPHEAGLCRRPYGM